MSYDPFSSVDPFSMSFSEMRWRMRYEMGIAASDPRAMAVLSDEDIDQLPGQLAHLAREMNAAPAGEKAVAAAQRFITASEEFLIDMPKDD